MWLAEAYMLGGKTLQVRIFGMRPIYISFVALARRVKSVVDGLVVGMDGVGVCGACENTFWGIFKILLVDRDTRVTHQKEEGRWKSPTYGGLNRWAGGGRSFLGSYRR